MNRFIVVLVIASLALTSEFFLNSKYYLYWLFRLSFLSSIVWINIFGYFIYCSKENIYEILNNFSTRKKRYILTPHFFFGKIQSEFIPELKLFVQNSFQRQLFIESNEFIFIFLLPKKDDLSVFGKWRWSELRWIESNYTITIAICDS